MSDASNASLTGSGIPSYDHSAQVYGAVPHLLAPTDLPR